MKSPAPAQSRGSADDPRRVADRVVAYDVARAVALAGMLVAHLLRGRTGWPRVVLDAVDGRAMALFVVVAGVGVAFHVASTPRPLADMVGRCVVLAAFGLALEGMTPVAVILQAYAVMLPAAVAVSAWSTRRLVALATGVVAAGAALQMWWADSLPQADDVIARGTSGAMLVTRPHVLAADLFATGAYPFFPTFAFVLAGLVVARNDLSARQARVKLAACGVSAAGFAAFAGHFFHTTGSSRWRDLFDTSGHSQMPGWVASSVGVACVVLAVCSSLPPVSRFARHAAALGRVSLSVYVAHIVALIATPRWPWSLSPETQLAVVVALVVISARAATWYLACRRHGPLEHFVRRAGRSVAAAGRR